MDYEVQGMRHVRDSTVMFGVVGPMLGTAPVLVILLKAYTSNFGCVRGMYQRATAGDETYVSSADDPAQIRLVIDLDKLGMLSIAPLYRGKRSSWISSK